MRLLLLLLLVALAIAGCATDVDPREPMPCDDLGELTKAVDVGQVKLPGHVLTSDPEQLACSDGATEWTWTADVRLLDGQAGSIVEVGDLCQWVDAIDVRKTAEVTCD